MKLFHKNNYGKEKVIVKINGNRFTLKASKSIEVGHLMAENLEIGYEDPVFSKQYWKTIWCRIYHKLGFRRMDDMYFLMEHVNAGEFIRICNSGFAEKVIRK